MVVHTYNPRTWRWRQKEHGFETSLGYMVTTLPKQTTNKNKTISQTVTVKTDWQSSVSPGGRGQDWGLGKRFLILT